jgi:hypothetical protein
VAVAGWAAYCSGGRDSEFVPPTHGKREIKGVSVREKGFTYSVISINRKCLRNSAANQRSRCSMSARSRAAESAMRVRGATLSKPQTRKLSSKKSCLVFVAPRMSAPCTLLRFKLKEEAFACGNAQNVTPPGLMRGCRASGGKRWEHELLFASLPLANCRKPELPSG